MWQLAHQLAIFGTVPLSDRACRSEPEERGRGSLGTWSHTTFSEAVLMQSPVLEAFTYHQTNDSSRISIFEIVSALD
jgi:hypothetical protein